MQESNVCKIKQQNEGADKNKNKGVNIMYVCMYVYVPGKEWGKRVCEEGAHRGKGLCSCLYFPQIGRAHV